MSKFRHFKGEIYEVHGISIPIEYNPFKVFTTFEIVHTETKQKIDLIKVDKDIMNHLEEDCKDVLVIYSKPHDKIWARPYDDFVSKVHIGRHDNKTKQPFRFMLVE